MPHPAALADDGSFDIMFKLLVVGDSSVGKSSFTKCFVSGGFDPDVRSSLGIDLETITVMRRKKRVRLQVWDTAGQERFRALSTAFFRMGMGFIVMYDVTSEASFVGVTKWLEQVKTHGEGDARVLLVANKCDLEDARAVSTKSGQDLADELEIPYHESSAKEGKNVHTVFECMMDLLLDDYEKLRNSGTGTAFDNESIQLTAKDLEQMPNKINGKEIKKVAGKKKCAC